MNRFQIENLYVVNGLNDFYLRSPEDLLKTHGINLESVKGFSTLSEDNKKLVKKFIINLLNSWGLESRISLIPLAINYVEDISYLVKENPDDNYFIESGGIVRALYANGKKAVLHKWANKDYVNLKSFQGKPNYYLRFEYKHRHRKEWLHVMSEHTWY